MQGDVLLLDYDNLLPHSAQNLAFGLVILAPHWSQKRGLGSSEAGCSSAFSSASSTTGVSSVFSADSVFSSTASAVGSAVSVLGAEASFAASFIAATGISCVLSLTAFSRMFLLSFRQNADLLCSLQERS